MNKTIESLDHYLEAIVGIEKCLESLEEGTNKLDKQSKILLTNVEKLYK